MSGQSLDTNKLQYEIEALKADWEQKWKAMESQYEEEISEARKEARDAHESAREARSNLRAEVERAMNSCFEQVNIEISDLSTSGVSLR